MADDKVEYRPFIPPPSEPIPTALPPNPHAEEHSKPSGGQGSTIQGGRRPFEGHYYQLSRKRNHKNAGLNESVETWDRQTKLSPGDTLIVETACAAPCWLYVIESDTDTGIQRLKICCYTDGSKDRHEYTITGNFDKLRVIFTETEITGLSQGSSTITKSGDQTQDSWLSNLDRFNPSGAIGGRGHGPILTPEENSMAPRFSFGPKPHDTQILQTKFLLRQLPSGYFLDVKVSPDTLP